MDILHLLSDCHGKRTILLSLLGALPFVGTWLRARTSKKV